MKKLTCCSILAVFLLLLSFGCHASSKKEEYELQEKCGKRAEEVFNKNFFFPDTNHGFTGYNAHYNKNLNECIMWLYGGPVPGNGELIFDVNENKELGSCSYDGDGKYIWKIGDKFQSGANKNAWEVFKREEMEN